MQILIVRHAIAEDEAPDGDAARQLTADGRKKMERGVRGIARLLPELELVISSPLVRAKQTAEILAGVYEPALPIVESETLAPGGTAEEVVLLVASQKSVGTLALVGHEPNLSRLEGYLLTGEERSLAKLKKGGALLVESKNSPEARSGLLLWHLTPSELRRLAP